MNHSLWVAALFVVAVLVSQTAGAGCNSATPSYGKANPFPILDMTEFNPKYYKLVNTVPNGKLYQVTVPNAGGSDASTFYVTHLYGTAYQMGFAQGQLLKPQCQSFISSVWAYFEEQIEGVLPNYFPKWFAQLISDMGLDAALDFTVWATKDYTGSYVYDELRGIADASGVNYDTLVRVHMIAGLTQGKCSMVGAWGGALDPTYNTSLIQLRALDWDMDGPFRDYAAITVYHPTLGHAFANVGMVSFIGGLTGVSSTQLGISEIGVAYPDPTFGDESRIGTPFIFILRDILQFDNTIDDAINRLANARRTCDLILGVGDGKMNEFRSFQYSYSVLNVMDDLNMLPYNQTWHPRMNNIVYYGMDWICPSYNMVLSQLLQKYNGKLTPDLALRYISPVEMSGDNHLAWYDLTNMKLFVSFAAPHAVAQSGPSAAAFNRQFTKLDLLKLFSEPTPAF